MAKKTSLSLIASSALLLAVLTLPRTGSGSVVRSWSMQHRWPQQTVYFYLDDQIDEETGDLWYRKATERPVYFTYDHSPRLWGVPLERAIFDGLNMLRRANPGLKFIRIDKNDAARFPTVVKVTKRPESSLFGMATTNGYGNGKSEQYEIRMNKWCHAGIMAHEMMHILGMAHIQSRADRDNYVVVFNGQTYLKGTASEFTVPDNLRTGHGNFNLLTRRRLLGGYDFRSIMHYSDSVMKKRPTDRSLVIPKVTIGRRLRPGPLRGIEDSRPSTGIHYRVENGNGRSYDAQRSQLSVIDRWSLREMYYHTYKPETGADFNGDGFADLLIGTSPVDPATDGGAVRVVYGAAYQSSTPGLGANNLVEARKEFADGQHDSYGDVLAYGDFNGDYRMDAVIGAPGSDGNAGSVHVIYGARDNNGRAGRIGLQVNAPGDDDLKAQRWSGNAAEGLGSAIAAADFNGDGFSDLAMGAPHRTVDGVVQRGAVTIHLGSKSGLSNTPAQTLTQSQQTRSPQAKSQSHFGAELAVGDFNSDGFSDLAIAAPDSDPEKGSITDAGSVFIMRGTNNGLDQAASWLHQGRGSVPGEQETGDRWGSRLAVADFDADGFQDLVIASHRESIFVNGANIDRAGQVTVIYGESSRTGIGPDNQRIVAFTRSDLGTASCVGDGFGHALAAADFNGDGYSDLAIGSPFEDGTSGIKDDGAVRIIKGGLEGLSLSSTTKVSLPDINDGSPNEGANMGWSLSNGDFDGNGYVDLVIGVPGRAMAGATSAGQIVVRYHGSPYDGPDTRIGRSFPTHVILRDKHLTNPNGPATHKGLGAVLP